MDKYKYEKIVSSVASLVYERLESNSKYYELSYDKEEDEEEMYELTLSTIDEIIDDLKIDVILRWCPLYC